MRGVGVPRRGLLLCWELVRGVRVTGLLGTLAHLAVRGVVCVLVLVAQIIFLCRFSYLCRCSSRNPYLLQHLGIIADHYRKA